MRSSVKTVKLNHPAIPSGFARLRQRIMDKLEPIRKRGRNFFGGPAFGAIDWDEYMDLRADWARKHPIRNFIYDNWDQPWVWLKNSYRFIRSRYFKRHHMLDLRNKEYEWGYCDPVQQILYANFAILSKFVESGEMSWVVWDEEIEKEIMALYDWWTKTYNEEDRWRLLGEEDEIAAENEMLIRLIKIRGHLWT